MSYKVYNITETELNYDGYEIKINGINVKPDTARVSLMPFNIRWPGHQRGMEQTELINFLSLETDEELNFEIKPKETFDKVVIRPLSLNHQYDNKDLHFNPDIVRVEVAFHHEYSAGGTRRGKNRKINFENIFMYGKHKPKFSFIGYNAESCVSDIVVKDFYLNDRPLKDDEYELYTNEFCENIHICRK